MMLQGLELARLPPVSQDSRMAAFDFFGCAGGRKCGRRTTGVRPHSIAAGDLVAGHTGGEMPDAARRDGGDSWVGLVKAGDARVVLQRRGAEVPC